MRMTIDIYAAGRVQDGRHVLAYERKLGEWWQNYMTAWSLVQARRAAGVDVQSLGIEAQSGEHLAIANLHYWRGGWDVSVLHVPPHGEAVILAEYDDVENVQSALREVFYLIDAKEVLAKPEVAA